MMMMSSFKLPYQRLKKLPSSIEEEDREWEGRARWPTRLRRPRRWGRPRVRIARLGRLVRSKARGVRTLARRVVRRLKEARPYVGDLFAGNYMFMQVTPSLPASPAITTYHKRMSFFPPAAGGPHFYSAAAAAGGFNMSRRAVS